MAETIYNTANQTVTITNINKVVNHIIPNTDNYISNVKLSDEFLNNEYYYVITISNFDRIGPVDKLNIYRNIILEQTDNGSVIKVRRYVQAEMERGTPVSHGRWYDIEVDDLQTVHKFLEAIYKKMYKY